MKKKLVVSWITTAALLVSMLGAVNVSAASLNVGVKQDFESAIDTGNALITKAQDEQYGGVLNLSSSANKADCDISFDFDQPALSGKYLMSFDAKMPELSGGSTVLGIFTSNAENKQLRFLELNGGRFLSTNDGASYTQIGNASYQPNVWQRYDVAFDFDAKSAQAYVNGELKGAIDLAALNVTGMKKILFLYCDYTKTALSAQVDNLSFRPLPASAEMTAEYTYKGQFEVNFSETVVDIDANDFILTRAPKNGGAEETVPFEVDYITADKAVLTPSLSGGAYTYKLTFANKKTILGNEISNREYTYTSNQQDIDWEYTETPNDYVSEDEEYRGSVLTKKSTNDAVINGNLSTPLTAGKYIFSYDVKFKNISKKVILVSLNDRWYQSIWEDGTFGEVKSGSWSCTRYGSNTYIKDNNWHRIDNVVDLDSKKTYTYLDGVYTGETDISDRIAAGASWNSISFNSTGPVTDATASFDNISVKSIDNGFDAGLSIAGENLVYIDFSETAYLTNDNIKVQVTSNPLSAKDAEEVGAEIVYQNGTRTAVKLDRSLVNGERCVVTLNGVKSFMGRELKKNALTPIAYATEKSDVIANDDMSSYAEGTLNNVGPWTNDHGDAYLYKDENGKVIHKGEGTTYTFDNPVTKGKISMELDFSTVRHETEQGFWVLFTDLNDNMWTTAIVWNNKVTIGDSWSISKDLTSQVKLLTEFDFDSDKVTISYNGEPIQKTPVCKNNDQLRPNIITGIKDIKLQPTGAISDDYYLGIDRIKVTNTYNPNIIGGISTTDLLGNTDYSLSEHKSTIKSINFEFDGGLQNNSLDGLVSINDGAFTDYTTSYDVSTKTGTITFNTLAGANQTYNIAITGAKTASGADYENLTGSFTTGDAITEVSNLELEKTTGGATVSVDIVNTAADKDYFIIYAAYDDNKLVKFDYSRVTADKNSNSIRKSYTFTDADIANHTKVSAFVWNSFESMKPVTRSVSK